MRHPKTILLSNMTGLYLLLFVGSVSGQANWKSKIKQAFSERAAKNHSFRIEYQREQFLTKNSQPMSMDGGDNKWMPPEDTTYHFSESIIWQGVDYKKAVRGPMFHATLGAYYDDTMITSEYQGKLIIFREKFQDTNTPYASINDGNKSRTENTTIWLVTHDLLPIFYYTGRLDLANSDLKDFDLLPGVYFFEDQECKILERLEPTLPNQPGIVFQIWLAIDMEFLPVRIFRNHNQTLLYDTSISYNENRENNRMLSQWEHTCSALNIDGEMLLKTSSDFKVSELESGVLLTEEDFQIEFRPYTFVDESKWRSGIEDRISYILMPDRSKRIVTEEELIRISSHAELFNTPTGMAGISKPKTRRRSMYIMIGILSASLLALVLGRRLRNN
ncbi:MAG TPA: hypothetical protein DEW46_15555 [Verrucomicrobia bacterium]|jgi:hypothetical protein|nr:hypothetical protein [Verrucomicrobiota bacterium]